MTTDNTQDDNGMANRNAEYLRRYNRLSAEEAEEFENQQQTALFELVTAALERDGEIATGVISNAADDRELSTIVINKLKKFQPVTETGTKLVVRDE